MNSLSNITLKQIPTNWDKFHTVMLTYYIYWILGGIVLLAANIWSGLSWMHKNQFNQHFVTKRVLRLPISSLSPEEHYARGYLLARHPSSSKDVHTAAESLLYAQISQNTEIRKKAKFASANLYTKLALQSSRIAEGGAHQQAVAQIELAREAYKDTLRIDPVFYPARFNLERLDRLSPPRRTQGWQGGVDGVTLQPFKKNGTAMMRDNTRRGLP